MSIVWYLAALQVVPPRRTGHRQRTRHVRPRLDFQQLEHRRKQAGRPFAAGKMIPAAIARQLKVRRQSVSRWYTEWKSGGYSNVFMMVAASGVAEAVQRGRLGGSV